MTPYPVGTLCASQTNTLSPCSAVPFLSHRQTPHPHTASYTHRHPHMHPHTHTHTHTQAQSLQEHRHRKHGDLEAVFTHQACGACESSPESQLGQSLELPHTRSQWDPRSSLRTRETVEGLRLTQLGPDQTSLFCKICGNDQWTPHRRGTSIHSRCGSFLVKNTEARLQNSRYLSLHQGIHFLL